MEMTVSLQKWKTYSLICLIEGRKYEATSLVLTVFADILQGLHYILYDFGRSVVCVHEFNIVSHEITDKGFNVQRVDAVRVQFRCHILHYILPSADKPDGCVHCERSLRLYNLWIFVAHLLPIWDLKMPHREMLAQTWQPGWMCTSARRYLQVSRNFIHSNVIANMWCV